MTEGHILNTVSLILRLAWRNIWRNLRRTLITLSAITFGLASIIVFNGFTDGFHTQWIENYVRAYTGHLQIHRKGYRDDPQLVKNISDPEGITSRIMEIPGVDIVTTRVELDGLASTAENSAGVLIKGVDIEKEARITNIRKRIIKGEYLREKKKDILIGYRLARKLGAGVGDKIVLMSQVADGTLGAELFRVSGIFRMGAIDFDSSVVLISLAQAQRFAVIDGRVTEMVVLIEGQEYLDGVYERLRRELAPLGLEVFTWRELMPALTEMIELDRVFMYIILVIVLVVVAFGILNTMLMSIMERTREFGIMMALGTNPSRIASMVITEAVFMGLIGSLAGVMLGLAGNEVISLHGFDLSRWTRAMEFFAAFDPVIYPETHLESVIESTVTVLITTVVSSIYPAFRVLRLKPVEAIHFV